jgi:hypothetical protein
MRRRSHRSCLPNINNRYTRTYKTEFASCQRQLLSLNAFWYGRTVQNGHTAAVSSVHRALFPIAYLFRPCYLWVLRVGPVSFSPVLEKERAAQYSGEPVRQTFLDQFVLFTGQDSCCSSWPSNARLRRRRRDCARIQLADRTMLQATALCLNLSMRKSLTEHNRRIRVTAAARGPDETSD